MSKRIMSSDDASSAPCINNRWVPRDSGLSVLIGAVSRLETCTLAMAGGLSARCHRVEPPLGTWRRAAALACVASVSTYLVRLLVSIVPTLVAVSLVVFAIFKFVPGDPA